jgi:4-hydroxyphenylacetate 3-monooxygenase
VTVRTGAEYIASLRDERAIWLDGERIEVTTDPRTARTVAAIADLYDLQHKPELRERMVVSDAATDAASGGYGRSFVEPHSTEDLVSRRAMMKAWADRTGGMMGRSPDFMNVLMTAFASASDYFADGGAEFGVNARAYYAHIRDNDLALTHVLINPQTNRAKQVQDVEQHTAARIIATNDAGVVIDGARMVSTLAPFTNEIAVFPSSYLDVSEEAKQYAFAFAISCATEGLRFICRPSLGPADGRIRDYPFSLRYDEMDAVAIFDRVLVPWERVFIFEEPRLANGLFPDTGAGAQTGHQTAVKSLAKAEFMLGVALALADSIGIDGFPQVQNHLAEMITTVELVRACVRAAEVDAIPGPAGTVLPEGEALWTLRLLMPQMLPRLAEIVQILGASGLVGTPSAFDVDGERADDIAQYLQSAKHDGAGRVALFRVAWEVSSSSFSGRQSLYERYYSGDPWRLGMTRFKTYGRKNEVTGAVWDFIERARELDRVEQENSTSRHVSAH